MKCLVLAWVLVMGLAHSAAAQAPGQIEPVTATFLEKRVPDELATEGVVLSRRNLGLQVEQLADRWLVSLVDLTTGRVAASTKVDMLPGDREAAVAAMTHVVAELAAQVVGRPEPPPPPPPPVAEPAAAAPAVELMLREQQVERAARAEREQREAAELAFKRKLIRFTDTYEPTSKDRYRTPRTRWVAYQGKPDQKLDAMTFYQEVGRPDLADAYVGRRRMMIGSFVLGGVSLGVGYGVLIYELAKPLSNCADAPLGQYDECRERNSPDYLPPLLVFGLGTVAIITGIYYATHRQPISESDAHALADAYNQRLRGRTGAPTGPQSSLLRDVHLVPYATPHAAELTIGARF